MRSKLLLILGIVVVAVIGGGVGYFWGLRSNTTTEVKNTAAMSVLEQLSQIMVLPDQAPTIAQVLNPETLKSQDPLNYKDLQAGDYLIVYSDKAIIFRTNENKIIQVLPVNK